MAQAIREVYGNVLIADCGFKLGFVYGLEPVYMLLLKLLNAAKHGEFTSQLIVGAMAVKLMTKKCGFSLNSVH